MELIEHLLEDSIRENVANFHHEMVSFEENSIQDFVRTLIDIPVHKSVSEAGRATQDLKI
jgi:hypothetical protein